LVLIFLTFTPFATLTSDCSRVPSSISPGKIFNLTAIVGRELNWSDSFSNYKVTICTNIYADCGSCGGPAGFCQYTTQWADCVGKFSTATPLANDEGVQLLYDDGDWGNVGRVKVICDPLVEFGTPTIDGNAKVIIVRSKHACLSLPPVDADCKKIPDTAGSGAFYNLSPLIGQQIFWTSPLSNLKASICTNSYPDCGDCAGAGFCSYTNTWSDCVGKFTMAVGLPDSKGVELFYEKGDFGYAGRVKIICDPSVDISTPTYDQNPFYATIRSKYACLCSWVCIPPY